MSAQPYYRNNSSEDKIRDERLESLKGKLIFPFMEGVNEKIAQEIYCNFLSEPHEQIIANISTLLERSQALEKSKEFLNWKNERLRNPPEDLQTLLSESDYNFVQIDWEKDDFTYIDKILNSKQYIDCMASFKETLKYLPLISEKNEKNNNLFLQAEGKRLIIKYIDELKKIDPFKRAKRNQTSNYSTGHFAQPKNQHPGVHGATDSSQGFYMSQSDSRTKAYTHLERKEFCPELKQDPYQRPPQAGAGLINSTVSAKSGKKNESMNTSQLQDVKKYPVLRSDPNYREEKSKKEQIPSKITHSAQRGSKISDISENQRLDQERHSVTTPSIETVIAARSGEKKEKEITILLLGETGAGKTTFINGLVNYIRDSELDTALQSGPRILTNIVFTITDDKHELAEIKEMGEENGPTDEILSPGQSCTQDPKIHRLAWDRNGERIYVNVIDTPGMNDTRGFDQDKRNFDKIFEYLKKYPILNSICFVMKPNESKLKPSFVYCLNSFLSYFHRNAVNNIVFCFTNTRSLLYRPGDTLAPLDLYLKELWDTKGIKIKLDRSNTFCFDNDSFRYLLALKSKKLERNDKDYILFSDGWKHNVGESHRFLEKAMSLSVHKAEDSLQIKEMAELVSNLAGNLGDMAGTMLENMKIIDENKTMIKNMEKEGNFLTTKLFSHRLVTRFSEVYYCTNRKCYKKHCSPLRDRAGYSYCSSCTCPWYHHNNEMISERIREPVKDQRVENELSHLGTQSTRAEAMLAALEKESAELDKEYAEMNDFCAEAAVFVKEYSIHTPVDRFRQALALLVENETHKSKAQGQHTYTEMFYQVSALLQEYEDKVKDIGQKISKGERQTPTNDELLKRLDYLKSLSSFGALHGLVEHHRTSAKKTSSSENQASPSQRVRGRGSQSSGSSSFSYTKSTVRGSNESEKSYRM